MLGDLLKATTSPERQTAFEKVVLTVIFEAFGIKGALKVLERKCEIQDLDVCFTAMNKYENSWKRAKRTNRWRRQSDAWREQHRRLQCRKL